MTEPHDKTFLLTDKAGFEKLFREHYSVLCSYANAFLKDPDASEEVVQEVFYRMWVNREHLEITSSAQSYLFRAVRNGCLNVIKHGEIREGYRVYQQSVAIEGYSSVEEKVMVPELEQKIREAIDRLPAERRKIFLLSRFEDMTYGQIAGKLNISIKTVENQMGKALKALREDLAEYLPLILIFFDIFTNK